MVTHVTWTPDLVKQFWTGVSASRLSELSFARHNAGYLVELVRDHLTQDGRHLDFGAGEGHLTKVLLDQGFRTAIFEPVGSRLSQMPEAIAAHPLFLRTTDDHSTERFDVVLLADVVEHILDQDLQPVLHRLRSLLTERGVVIVTTPYAEDLELGAAYCPTCRTLFHRWQHVRSFTRESLAALFETQGFERVRLQEVDFSCNRFRYADSKTLYEAYEAVRTRHARSWLARVRRFLGYSDKIPYIQPQSSPTGVPTHFLYVGRAKGR